VIPHFTTYIQPIDDSQSARRYYAFAQ
jgi:hypothetical protein